MVDKSTLERFFLNGMLIGFAFLLFSFGMFHFCHDLVIKIQQYFFSAISVREIEHSLLILYGVFKLLILTFFLLPYLALKLLPN